MSVKQEVLIGGFYYVDFLIEDLNMVIEVNGPLHYNMRGLRSNAKLKYKILEKLGYKVAVISYKSWKWIGESHQSMDLNF